MLKSRLTSVLKEMQDLYNNKQDLQNYRITKPGLRTFNQKINALSYFKKKINIKILIHFFDSISF